MKSPFLWLALGILFSILAVYSAYSELIAPTLHQSQSQTQQNFVPQTPTPTPTPPPSVPPESPKKAEPPPQPHYEPSVKFLKLFHSEYIFRVRLTKDVGWYDTDLPLIASSMVRTFPQASCTYSVQIMPSIWFPTSESAQVTLWEQQPPPGNPGFVVPLNTESTLKLKLNDDHPYVDVDVYLDLENAATGFDIKSPDSVRAPYLQWALAKLQKFF